MMTGRQNVLATPLRGIQQSLLVPERPYQPTESRGVVYTKRWVVDLLLDLAGYRPGEDLIDAVAIEPAAGDGAFLGPMIQRLLESCRIHKRRILDCAGSLAAYELDEGSASRARRLAVRTLEDGGVSSRDAEGLASAWVRSDDYLFAQLSDADFVVGNPPYVRLEDIPEQTAGGYRSAYPTMRGRADLYIAFFEAALRQLRPGGVCAFICADRWMRNQYGATLRGLVTSGFSVKAIIEMHDADAFHDEVDAYPAITIIMRESQGSAIVATAGADLERVSAPALFAALSTVGGRTHHSPLPGLRAAVVENWFKGTDPWPLHSPEQLRLLRRLEDRFPALESYAKVGIGVATGNDEVFITKNPDLVEPSRLLKIALARDLCTGALKWSGHFLVDPWDKRGLVDLKKYPRLKAYLERHEVALKNRHTAKKNSKGWYKTIDRVNHALASRSKLYIPDIKDTLEPVLDDGQTYPHHNLYFIESEEWDLEVLGGLLISAVGQFFVESYGVRMRGGYLRFQAQYLRRIRTPQPGEISACLAERLRAAFRNRDRRQATLAAIELYGIDEQEIEIPREQA
jgi:adenine-specific DNA-methyltransferase